MSEEKRLLGKESRILAQSAKEALRRWENTRSYHHDVRNYLLVVSGLLKKGLQEDAAIYLDSLVTASDELTPRTSTGN